MEFFIIASMEEEDAHKQTANFRRCLRDSSNPLEMDNVAFVQHYRVSKAAFVYILELIQDKFRPQILKTSIPDILKLAATLRFCAQGSYQLSVGNCSKLGMAQSTISVVLEEVFKILEEVLCPKVIKFSFAEDDLSEAKLAFYNKSGFPGVIGCVDGTHIKIVAPRKEIQNLYYNRKGYHSINAMLVCDHKMQIKYLNAKYPGASHDSMVFRMSALAQKLEAVNNGRNKYWLLGDAGYPLKPCLMTPFRCAEEGSMQCTYNKIHARTRCIVERTIGVLKSRFRCLLSARALHYAPEKATRIINVCAALHNICIQFNVEEPEEVVIQEGMNNHEVSESDEELPNNEADAIRRRIMFSFV